VQILIQQAKVMRRVMRVGCPIFLHGQQPDLLLQGL
jgi:hypothetical protein